ncbi:MAG: hypothetical protein M1834_007756 [Cirrosporium novae-zelandiae]|nr:MAG: hypothetical protein M1834_007756 [Cirrosporium novae-zelandiae]
MAEAILPQTLPLCGARSHPVPFKLINSLDQLSEFLDPSTTFLRKPPWRNSWLPKYATDKLGNAYETIEDGQPVSTPGGCYFPAQPQLHNAWAPPSPNAYAQDTPTYIKKQQYEGQGFMSPPFTNNQASAPGGPVPNPFENGQTLEGQNLSHIPRKHQKGYRNIAYPHSLKWAFPNIYKKPGQQYMPNIIRRHLDAMSRVWTGPEDDRYISPMDARLSKLVVQAVDDIYEGPPNSTWRRTFVRNTSPLILRLANLPLNRAPLDRATWDAQVWATVAGKWLISSMALLCVMNFQLGSTGQVRNNGYYDPFHYKFWGYPKIARNPQEGQTLKRQGNAQQPTNAVMERTLDPRYLCFLKNPKDDENYDFEIWPVALWKERHPEALQHDMRYVVVAYTAKHFSSDEDLKALDRIAVRAARDAGVPAYWCGSNCMRDPSELEDDVYRISDVIRGSHSVIIALNTAKDSIGAEVDHAAMLKEWGDRMWTLPEALLSPKNQPLKIYTDDESAPPFAIEKQNFASLAWHDALISRQLIDHYEGNLTLGRLELVTLALRCISTRTTSEQKFPGDMAYILMGLLRQRPTIDKTDSAFQAFARLSLANDSDMLLERLICVLPASPSQPWHCMSDAYNINLWDIYPTCQISGVATDDTIIIDGAFGACIRWKSFAPVANVVQASWRRLFSRITVHGAPTAAVIGLILAFIYSSGAAKAIGVLILLYSLVIVLLSPYLVRLLYGGKLWGTQPWFFGFEGHLDLPTIESHVFGNSIGRLAWSTCGSNLSRHIQNQHGECIGIDPTSDPAVAAMVGHARYATLDEEKVFTLVDTYMMTVTMFKAVRPPVAVLICGAEGGMQRAVLCSYGWKSQTCWREAVLRMETPVLEKMSRVGRVRFGFRRPVSGGGFGPVGGQIEAVKE